MAEYGLGTEASPLLYSQPRPGQLPAGSSWSQKRQGTLTTVTSEKSSPSAWMA